MNSLKEDLNDLKDLYDLYNLWKEYKRVRSSVQQPSPKRRKKNAPRYKTRNIDGYYRVTFLKIKELDSEQFFIHTRMDKKNFEYLLSICHSFLVKNSIRTAISPEMRLALTLLFLSQGWSIASLACMWKLGKETVRSIIHETCDILWNSLSAKYVREPSSEKLSRIAEDFWRLCDMPNCIGAIGGKHIAVVKPLNAPYDYLNYKKFHSIEFLAACDTKYAFTFIDVGAYVSQSGAGVFQESTIGKRLLQNELCIPGPAKLPNSEKCLPHFFVADAAFPLHKNIMKSFPQASLTTDKEIYNKRISRAQRMIENSFGILTVRWRILPTMLNMFPENAKKIVLACVSLHNFLILNDDETQSLYIPSEFCDWEDEDGNLHDGLWRMEISKNLESIPPSRNIHVYSRTYSTNLRNELCQYVNNEGFVN